MQKVTLHSIKNRLYHSVTKRATFWLFSLAPILAIGGMLFLVIGNGQTQDTLKISLDKGIDVPIIQETHDGTYGQPDDNTLRVAIAEVRNRQKNGLVQKSSNDVLSKREKEVLQLLAMGYTNQQVAEKLFLSVKTIESYKSRFKGKLRLKSRVDMIRYAIHAGLLDVEV